MNCDAQLSMWVQYGLSAAAFFVFALWERWLGRTSKTKANSTIDLIVSVIKPKSKEDTDGIVRR